jgi:hypothetical protein
MQMNEAVTPAEATKGSAEPGVQEVNLRSYWIPAFAGMTEGSNSIGPDQSVRHSS